MSNLGHVISLLNGVEALASLVGCVESLNLLFPIGNKAAEIFHLGDLAAELTLQLLSLSFEAISALIGPLDLGGPNLLPLRILLARQGGSSRDGVTQGERGGPLL